MKTAIIKLVSFFLILVLGIGFYIYNTQEDLLFHPQFLPKDYNFELTSNFEEITHKTKDNISLNSLLFKTEKPKGLVIFFHGNSGSISDWKDDYKFYNELGYDFLITDYRGFGKSDGTINSQDQVLNDALLVFDSASKQYRHKLINVVGYSFGSSVAAYVASKRKVKSLILLAPFYSLIDMKKQIYPLIPNFLLKYNFETYKYIDQVEEDILIFHGVDDKLIGIESSKKLKKHLKNEDEFIELENQDHFRITQNQDFKKRLKRKLDIELISFE